MNKQYQLTGRTNYCLIKGTGELGKTISLEPQLTKFIWGTSQNTLCITFFAPVSTQHSQNFTEFPHTLCPEPICCRFRRTLLSTSSRLGPSSQSTRPRSARLLNFCCSAFFTRSFEVCSTRTLFLSVCTAFLRRKHF